jgi:hypothetical protein
MALSERDIKILWGRAAGHCAICGRKLTQDEATASASYPLGEHAHIVGEKPTSARYDSVLDDRQRNGYPNRILLCPNDHTIIDNDPRAWPVERLYVVKAEHELRVETTLTTGRNVRDEAASLIYADAVDTMTTELQLDRFLLWASYLLRPYWRSSDTFIHGADLARRTIVLADWPGTMPDLEVALDRASFEILEAATAFSELAEADGDELVVRRLPHEGHTQEEFDREAAALRLWSYRLEHRIAEAARALNWVREIWRAGVNPMWLPTQGWFGLHVYADETDRNGTVRPRYTAEEKATLLAGGVGQGDVRAPANHLAGP